MEAGHQEVVLQVDMSLVFLSKSGRSGWRRGERTGDQSWDGLRYSRLKRHLSTM